MAGIDHIAISVPHDKLEEEVKFLAAALAPMGVKELWRPVPGVVGMGDSMANPFLWVSATEGGKPITAEGPGWHVAIKGKDVDQIKAFHKAALEAGGKDNGPPGTRTHYHPGYYGAFVIDPCGNNIEVVIHNCPESVKD